MKPQYISILSLDGVQPPDISDSSLAVSRSYIVTAGYRQARCPLYFYTFEMAGVRPATQSSAKRTCDHPAKVEADTV